MDSAMKMKPAELQPTENTPNINPISSSSESEWEECESRSVAPEVTESPPPTWRSGVRASASSSFSASRNKKRLSKQMSMRETSREAAWERRRRQALRRMRDMGVSEEDEEAAAAAAAVEEEATNLRRVKSLTDEDLAELRGSIELGFGFTEEDGHDLRDTLPALGLYFAVNRQFSDPKMQTPSPVSTPTTAGGASPSLAGSPRSPSNHSGSSDNWKLLNPGDSPQHVKTRLRHWAQAVACSVRQCC